MFDLYEAGEISFEDALRNADSVSEFKLNVKLNSKRRQGDPSAPKVELRLHPGLDEEKAEEKPVSGPASFAPSPDPVQPSAPARAAAS